MRLDALRVAGNGAGAVLATWNERRSRSSPALRTWSVAYDPVGGWEPPLVFAAEPVEMFVAGLVVDAEGNGWAAGVASGGRAVAVRRFITGVGWQPVQLLPRSESPSHIDVAVDAAGRVHVVWVRQGVYSARHVPGFGWDAPVRLSTSEPDQATIMGGPYITLAPDGGGVVVWVQRTSNSPPQLLACDRPPGGDWSAAVSLAILNDSNLARVELVAGEGGEVILASILQSPVGLGGPMQVRCFVPTLGWLAPIALGSPLNSVVKVAPLAGATALVGWRGAEGRSSASSRWISRLYCSGQVDAPTSVPDDRRAASDDFDLATDPSGRAFALWVQAKRTWAQRLVADTWELPEAISSAPAEVCGPHYWDRNGEWDFLPRVHVDAGGNALALWLRGGCDWSSLQAARYQGP